MKKYIGFEEGQKELVIPETVTVDRKEYTITDVNSEYYLELGIEAVTISDGITEIDDHTLSGFLFLESVEIPESLTRIEDSTFSFCGFTELTIPERGTEIGVDAFSYTKIESLKFPSNSRQHRTKHVR